LCRACAGFLLIGRKAAGDQIITVGTAEVDTTNPGSMKDKTAAKPADAKKHLPRAYAKLKAAGRNAAANQIAVIGMREFGRRWIRRSGL